MPIITYCKGIPTREEDMNALGQTDLEMFLYSYSQVFHKAVCETVEHLRSIDQFNKSAWNTHLQSTYQVNKRHANSIISYSKGAYDSAKECRSKHIKTLEGQLKSTREWIAQQERKLILARRFYRRKNWQQHKNGCNFPIASNLKTKKTNWHYLKFNLHHKKRKAYLLERKIEHLKAAPIYVSIPKNHVFFVGSKDETLGNQVCQHDGLNLRIRVPRCLEFKYGEYVTGYLGNFDRKVNRIPETGAKTWHLYRKDSKWVAALQFTPSPVEQTSRNKHWGCIGIDMNPSSIGWAYVDQEGNLKAKGQLPLLMGLPKGKQQAQIIDACLQLATLAETYACPIVCEELDFSTKKQSLREKGKKYARMLSSWAYFKFYQLLESILSNRGVELITVNPAYTSLIGLVKYARVYGLSSDCAAAIAIARRGMWLSEKVPDSITAYLEVNSGKHVWSQWRQINNLIKQSRVKRHQFYSTTNCWLQVNAPVGANSSSA